MKSALRSVALAGAAAVLLAGCANTYRLDNTVESFSGLTTLPATPTYRFERLPSQAAQPGHAQLEALADPALFRAGLRRDDASPRYSVQVSARVTQVLSPWADPWLSPYGWGMDWRYGWGPRWGVGGAFGPPFPRTDQPWFIREVGVLVRDVGTNQVVFESHANSDGPWLDHSDRAGGHVRRRPARLSEPAARPAPRGHHGRRQPGRNRAGGGCIHPAAGSTGGALTTGNPCDAGHAQAACLECAGWSRPASSPSATAKRPGMPTRASRASGTSP